MLNILSLLLAVSQRCTSYLNPPFLKMQICTINDCAQPSKNFADDGSQMYKFACLASNGTFGKFAGSWTLGNFLRLLDFDRLKPIPIHF